MTYSMARYTQSYYYYYSAAARRLPRFILIPFDFVATEKSAVHKLDIIRITRFIFTSERVTEPKTIRNVNPQRIYKD